MIFRQATEKAYLLRRNKKNLIIEFENRGESQIIAKTHKILLHGCKFYFGINKILERFSECFTIFYTGIACAF